LQVVADTQEQTVNTSSTPADQSPPTPPGAAAPAAPSETGTSPAAPPVQAREPSRTRRFFWSGKIGPAFWTIGSVLSILLNIILIIILIFLGRQLFALKQMVQVQLIGGLYENFVQMDQASIRTTITVSDTITVNDTIPVVFDLPLKQSTVVILVEDTPIKKATVYLNNTAVPTDITLRKGTKLYAGLDMVVPVNQTVPVVLKVPVLLKVPVDIPLQSTDLHKPFVGLQGVVAPYKSLMEDLPGSWDDIPLCRSFLTRWFCKAVLGAQ
jgi:hypothetical protein